MLVGMLVHDLGRDFLDRRNGLIEAVTLEDLRQVSARLFSASCWSVWSEIRPGFKRLLEALRAPPQHRAPIPDSHPDLTSREAEVQDMAIWEGRELAHRSPQPQLLARGVRYAGKQAAQGRRQVPPRRRRSATLFGRHRRGHRFFRLANTSICSPAIRWKCTDQAVIVQYMHSIEDLAGQPPIDGLAAFEAMADAGSFSKAAFLLRTTHSTVSRRLAAVEHWVGFKLVERSPRGVELTPDGQAYLTDVQSGLGADLGGPREPTRSTWRRARGALATPASFASFVLFPLLVRLEQQPTPLRIDLAIGNRLTDFAGERVDLAIRRGIGPWPGVRGKLADLPGAP